MEPAKDPTDMTESGYNGQGTRDAKINANASDRLLELKSSTIEIKGHSIMGGMHNLRNDRTIADFEEKVDSILK